MTIKKVYQEKDSVFTSDGIIYDLNYIFRETDNTPIEKMSVSQLIWILEGDKEPRDQERIDKTDLTIPILVTQYKGKDLVVDGYHRLLKAVHNKIKTLPCKHVSEKIMKNSIIGYYKPSIESIPFLFAKW